MSDPSALRHSRPPVTVGFAVSQSVVPSAPLLTPRQEAVLRESVRRGYYAIPRRTTLRALAKELGLSATSLSLLLRRAEARLVRQHVGTVPSPGPTTAPTFPPDDGRNGH